MYRRGVDVIDQADDEPGLCVGGDATSPTACLRLEARVAALEAAMARLHGGGVAEAPGGTPPWGTPPAPVTPTRPRQPRREPLTTTRTGRCLSRGAPKLVPRRRGVMVRHLTQVPLGRWASLTRSRTSLRPSAPTLRTFGWRRGWRPSKLRWRAWRAARWPTPPRARRHGGRRPRLRLPRSRHLLARCGAKVGSRRSRGTTPLGHRPLRRLPRCASRSPGPCGLPTRHRSG